MASSSRGNITVEAALVLPLLILSLFALTQFGLMVAAKLTTLAAGHAAARAACVYPTPRQSNLAAGYLLARLAPLESTWGLASLAAEPVGTEAQAHLLLVKTDCFYRPIFPMGSRWLGTRDGSLHITSTFYIQDELKR